MNKTLLTGRLTKDPDIRYSQSNNPTAVARYTLAARKDFQKEGEPEADFIPCVAFGKTAEFAGKYFKKGMKIEVEGRLNSSSYDKDNGEKYFSLNVVVEKNNFAEKKAGENSDAEDKGFLG